MRNILIINEFELFFRMRLLMFSILFIFIGQTLFSQSTVKLNEYNVFLNGKISPVMSLSTSSKLGEKWKFKTYFYASENWGEGLVGFSYKFTDWFELGYIGGFQVNGKSFLRGAPIFGVNVKHYSVQGFYEHGGDFMRGKIKAFYNFTHVRYGFEAVRSGDLYAIGPRSEVYLFKKFLKIWGSVLYAYNEKSPVDPIAGQLGFLFTFK